MLGASACHWRKSATAHVGIAPPSQDVAESFEKSRISSRRTSPVAHFTEKRFHSCDISCDGVDDRRTPPQRFHSRAPYRKHPSASSVLRASDNALMTVLNVTVLRSTPARSMSANTRSASSVLRASDNALMTVVEPHGVATHCALHVCKHLERLVGPACVRQRLDDRVECQSCAPLLRAPYSQTPERLVGPACVRQRLMTVLNATVLRPLPRSMSANTWSASSVLRASDNALMTVLNVTCRSTSARSMSANTRAPRRSCVRPTTP